jgi:hypothetical protein
MGEMRPMIEVYYSSYFKAETHVVAQINGALETILQLPRGSS